MRGAAERLGVELAGEWPGQEGSKSDGPGPVNTSLGVRHDFTRFECERVSVVSVDEARLLELASSKSYSSDRDSSRLVHTFWACVGALWIDVVFEYVRSAANIADWPSRNKLDFVAGLGARV